MSLKARLRLMLVTSATVIAAVASPANAAVMMYGDTDCLGFGCYLADDPTAGATLQGLATGAHTFASKTFTHSFPNLPGGGDFPGMDVPYVGSHLTHADDGYAANGNPVTGPQMLTLDYSSLVPHGANIASLTLGIAADDFQFPHFGNPFVASVNGVVNADLTALLNNLNNTNTPEGALPTVQFFTLGIDPTTLDPSNLLKVSIDEGGDGGDGWAVDFATVGVTTAAVPEPMTLTLFGAALASVGAVRRKKKPASP